MKASILIPKNPWVWNCLGHHSLALQEKEKAKESFQKACLFGDSSSCKVFFHLQERTLGGIWEVGKVWTQVGSSSLSKNTLQASCQLGLKTACHSLSIDLLKSAKEWEEQLQFYKANLLYHKATQVSPQHALSWKKKGLFFMRQRWWKEACSAFKKSLGLDHKQPFVWNQLADCYRSYAKILFQKQNRAYFQACRLGEEKACKKILKHKSK